MHGMRQWYRSGRTGNSEPYLITVATERERLDEHHDGLKRFTVQTEGGDAWQGRLPNAELIDHLSWPNADTIVVVDDALPGLIATEALLPCWQERGWKLTWWIVRDPPVMITLTKGDTNIRIVSWDTILPKVPKGNAAGHNANSMMHRLCWWRDTLHVAGLGRMMATMTAQCRRALGAWRGPSPLLIGAPSPYHDIAGECSLTGYATMPQGRGRWRDCVALDIKGCYATIMQRDGLPIAGDARGRTPSVATLWRNVTTRPCIARVTVSDHHGRIPPRRGERARWLPWHGETTLAGPELHTALTRGVVDSCQYCAAFVPGKPLATYAAHINALRTLHKTLGDSIGDGAMKMLGNRIYGALGAYRRKWRDLGPAADGIVAQWSEYDAATRAKLDYRVWNGRLWLDEQIGWPRPSAPWLSAWIASQARAWMTALVAAAGSKCYYADTDGLIVHSSAVDDVMAVASSAAAYDIAIEGEGTLHVEAVKRYQLGKRIRASGYNTDGALLLTDAKIDRRPSAVSALSDWAACTPPAA